MLGPLFLGVTVADRCDCKLVVDLSHGDHADVARSYERSSLYPISLVPWPKQDGESLDDYISWLVRKGLEWTYNKQWRCFRCFRLQSDPKVHPLTNELSGAISSRR